MQSATLRAFVAVLTILLIHHPANAQSTSWTGAQDNNWFQTSNWTSGVPDSATDAHIDSGGTPSAIDALIHANNLFIAMNSDAFVLFPGDSELELSGLTLFLGSNDSTGVVNGLLLIDATSNPFGNLIGNGSTTMLVGSALIGSQPGSHAVGSLTLGGHASGLLNAAIGVCEGEGSGIGTADIAGVLSTDQLLSGAIILNGTGVADGTATLGGLSDVSLIQVGVSNTGGVALGDLTVIGPVTGSGAEMRIGFADAGSLAGASATGTAFLDGAISGVDLVLVGRSMGDGDADGSLTVTGTGLLPAELHAGTSEAGGSGTGALTFNEELTLAPGATVNIGAHTMPGAAGDVNGTLNLDGGILNSDMNVSSSMFAGHANGGGSATGVVNVTGSVVDVWVTQIGFGGTDSLPGSTADGTLTVSGDLLCPVSVTVGGAEFGGADLISGNADVTGDLETTYLSVAVNAGDRVCEGSLYVGGEVRAVEIARIGHSQGAGTAVGDVTIDGNLLSPGVSQAFLLVGSVDVNALPGSVADGTLNVVGDVSGDLMSLAVGSAAANADGFSAEGAASIGGELRAVTVDTAVGFGCSNGVINGSATVDTFAIVDPGLVDVGLLTEAQSATASGVLTIESVTGDPGVFLVGSLSGAHNSTTSGSVNINSYSASPGTFAVGSLQIDTTESSSVGELTVSDVVPARWLLAGVTSPNTTGMTVGTITADGATDLYGISAAHSFSGTSATGTVTIHGDAVFDPAITSTVLVGIVDGDPEAGSILDGTLDIRGDLISSDCVLLTGAASNTVNGATARATMTIDGNVDATTLYAGTHLTQGPANCQSVVQIGGDLSGAGLTFIGTQAGPGHADGDVTIGGSMTGNAGELLVGVCLDTAPNSATGDGALHVSADLTGFSTVRIGCSDGPADATGYLTIDGGLLDCQDLEVGSEDHANAVVSGRLDLKLAHGRADSFELGSGGLTFSLDGLTRADTGNLDQFDLYASMDVTNVATLAGLIRADFDFIPPPGVHVFDLMMGGDLIDDGLQMEVVDLPPRTTVDFMGLTTDGEGNEVLRLQVTVAGGTALEDVQIMTGALLGGDVTDLEMSDDSYLHTRSGFGQALLDLHHMEMLVSAVTTVDEPTNLILTIESRIDEPVGTAQVRLRNWNSGQFELVHTYAVHDTDETVIIPGIDATDYVNALGEIDVSIKQLVHVPFLAFQFDSFFDLVEIAVE